MKLYHYTSIETLALILKNGTIKFNRLDTVDDLEEAGYTSDGMQLGKYMFVSCWTKSSEENIALWSMYADKGKGIRIELDEDMFREYKAQDTQYVKVAKQEENILIPLSEIIRDDCMFFIPKKIINISFKGILFTLIIQMKKLRMHLLGIMTVTI